MKRDPITPKLMQLNETEPQGFTTAPRVLSFEVAKMREQIAALCDAVLLLTELQREVAQKVEAALSSPINGEAA